MSYTSSTDFLALLRQTSGGVRSTRMPGLDYLLAGFARAGLIRLSVGQTAPTADQSITAWLQPSSPSFAAEGTVFLWDAVNASYEPATPTLWQALFLSAVPAPAPVPASALIGGNLFRNAGLGFTTQVSTVLVGARVQITGYAQEGGAGSGNARFTTVGGNAGLQPGKLVAIMGPNTAVINATCTATGGNTLTGPPGTFSQSIGDLIWNKGGNNASPRTQYVVKAVVGTTSITVNGGLVDEVGKTYNILAIQGGYVLNPTVNGMPAVGNPNAPAFFYYPLQVTAVGPGWFNAQLAGRYPNVGATSTAGAFEVTNGSQETGFIGPDWWSGTFSLSYFKMRGTDWDGVTSVCEPGALYSAKIVKGITGPEYFWQDLTASNPAYNNVPNPARLTMFQGKAITFGAYLKTPAASQGRLFIYDGETITFSPNVNPGSLQWTEVRAIISPTATLVQAGMATDAGLIGDSYIFTQPDCRYGFGAIGVGNYRPATSPIHMFVNHMNPLYYIDASVSVSTFVNIEQETHGLLPTGLEAVQSDIGGINAAISTIQLRDAPGSPSMSALVTPNPSAASAFGIDTGWVGVSRRAAGDGLGFFIDTQYIFVDNPGWTFVTIDYMGYMGGPY